MQPETAKARPTPFQVTSGKYRFARAAEHVRAAGEPITVKRLAESLGVTRQEAETMALRAIRAGLVKETAHQMFHAV